eukprot:6185211-Pleurochrysis_carterae.AAC.1
MHERWKLFEGVSYIVPQPPPPPRGVPVCDCGDEPRASGAKRMAERERAAVDVELLHRHSAHLRPHGPEKLIARTAKL